MTYIIAEAGTAHAAETVEERFALAAEHIALAYRAGADAVKFQIFTSHDPLFCPMEGDENRWQRWNKTLLGLGDWLKLKSMAQGLCIDLLASVFQESGVNWIKELQPRFYKVASRAAKAFPYHRVSGPFIISTGFGIPPVTDRRVSMLECVPEYPTPLYKARWKGELEGLSDHSGTPWPGIDAIVRGAKFLEVHFAASPAHAGNDPCLSPDQLKQLCEIRDGIARMRAT